MALVAHSTFQTANRSRVFSTGSSKAIDPPKAAVNLNDPVVPLRLGESHSSKLIARRAPTDVRLPCMLYAAAGAFLGDTGEDTQLAIAQIRKLHGVLHVIRYESTKAAVQSTTSAGIAVVTRGYWFSRQALARLMALCGGAVGMFAWNSQLEAGEADARVTRGTAQFVDGHLHLWLATVDPARSRANAALIANIAQDFVNVRVIGQPQSEAGCNVLVAAIAMARALQPSPVQVIVAQEFEHRSEPCIARANVSALPAVGPLRSAGAKDLAA